MPSDYRPIVLSRPFQEVVEEIKQSILQQDFLLIHEINTQQILSQEGIVILGLRQLLFFHPRYMQVILQQDPTAIMDVPLKFIVRELEGNRTEVTCADPLSNFRKYTGLAAMTTALREQVDQIRLSIMTSREK